VSKTHGITDLCEGEIAKNSENVNTCGRYGKEENLDLHKLRVSVVNKISGWAKLPAEEYKDLLDYCQIWPCRDRTQLTTPPTSKPARRKTCQSKPPSIVRVSQDQFQCLGDKSFESDTGCWRERSTGVIVAVNQFTNEI